MTQEITTEQETAVLRRRSPWQRLMDRLFGYDFFVSYRWSDGAHYAVSLASALKGKGYVCFLDARDFKPGGNWAAMDRQALRRTSRLILVATADAITDPRGRSGADDPIVHELEAFRASGRHKVRIQFPGFDPAAWRSSPLSRYFDDKELYLQEAADAREPSPAILAELERLCGLETEDRRRIRRLKLVVASLSLLLVAAAAATGVALVMRARAAENKASAGRDEARAKKHGEEAARKAEQERIAREQAKEAATRARDQVRITAVREAVNDPTTQLVLLREVERPAQVQRWRQLVADILPNPVADNVLEIRTDADYRVVAKVSFSPDGSRVVAVSADGPLIWPIDGSGAPLVLRGHENTITSVSFSTDGSRVVTSSEDGTARVWRADGSGEILVVRHEKTVHSAAFSPDGAHIVTASEDGTARVSPVAGTREPFVMRHEKAVKSATFSPDGARIVTVSDDGTAQVWRPDGSDTPLILTHPTDVKSASFSPDSARIVTASSDGLTRVWRADGPGDPVELSIPVNNSGLSSASFSPDGTRIVNSGVVVWKDDGSGAWNDRRPRELRESIHDMNTVSFSPTGFRGPLSVLSATQEGTAIIAAVDHNYRDSEHREESIVLRGPESDVNSAAWSSDGARVVTDSEVYRAWQSSDDTPALMTTRRGALRVWRVAASFSSDDSRVFTYARGGAVDISSLEPDALLPHLWRATPYCLPVSQRRARLAETDEDAAANLQRCKDTVARYAAEGAYR